MSALEQLEEHKQKPQHLGKLIGCDAVGDVGSIVVGDALRFFINVKEEVISEARFQVFGAAEMIAAASVLCEMLPGKTVQEARRLRPQHICDHLGGLDRYQLPPQVWALDAMNVALDMYQGFETPLDDDLESLVCRCHGVSERQIRDAIEEDQCDDIDKIGGMTFAGTGCGTCKADIQKILDDVLKPESPTPTADASSGLQGRIPLMRKINTIVSGEFADLSIELWDFAGDQVIIKIHTELSPEEREQARDRIQRRIQDEVQPQLQVVLAS